MKTHAPVQGKSVLDAEALGRTLSRIAHEIIEGNPAVEDVALVGIQTRGVPLAQRLARLIEERSGTAPALGAVDITFHRDDVMVRGGEAPLAPQPLVRATSLDFALDGRTVVLVDDVLYTGRTIRAAIEALFDYGRPERVQLAVLVDRGHRELPIRPDYVGKNLPTARDERIQVQLVEVDEVDARPARRRAGGGRADDPSRHRRLAPARASAEAAPHLGRRPHTRRRRAAARHGAHVRGVARTPREEAADAQGPSRRQPLLRVLDAHVVLVRARSEAASADTLNIKAVGSSVDKGESLKDTALTLSAYDPDVIVIRHPQIGAPQLVAATVDAHIVNAGDGKNQHPTQALLDLYTLQEELGRLEGLHVAIVGDVLHSRVARSLIQAFALVGIRTTLVGPPALLPRELPAEMTTDIDAIRDADVIYVLRMQNERMQAGANFVPSLREYTARWGITPERVRPGQKVMHPGPMNRGVEIDPRVADSPESLVVRQVRAGLVTRMAVLYDVLTGGPVDVQALAAVEVA